MPSFRAQSRSAGQSIRWLLATKTAWWKPSGAIASPMILRRSDETKSRS